MTIHLILLSSALASVTLFFLWRTVSSYLRLRAFPGPSIASTTDFWLMNKFWKQEPWRLTSIELHKRYGPVVRYGPNRLMFSDPASIPVILSTSNVFEKADSYDVLKATVRGREVPSFIGAKPEARASALKKHIASVFAPGHVVEYEKIVDDTSELLVQQLKQHGPVVDLVEWLRYFAFDTLSRIAFSEDLGFMVNKQDMDGTLAGAEERFDHWHYWFATPYLERLLFKNPFVLSFTKPSSRLAKLAVERITTRTQQAKDGTNHSDLLSKYLEASKKDPEVIDAMTVIGLTVSTIHAGSDTTAATMGILMSHLLRHPAKLAKLEAELATLPPAPRFNDLNKLSYLQACIKESMRIDSISGDPIERVVPPTGASIAGTWVPGSTVVSVSAHVVHRDPTIWGPDPDSYNPDRWIDADEVQRRGMERASLGFGAGKRICLGQHIAWLEMKKLIPVLLRSFKIELVEPEKELELSPKLVMSPKELMVRLQSKDA